MEICRRCGLHKSGYEPVIPALPNHPYNPTYCAWCNAVVVGRITTERHQYARTPTVDAIKKIVAGVCPECGGTLWEQGGCSLCIACGYERC